jgi:hypothetical protein
MATFKKWRKRGAPPKKMHKSSRQCLIYYPGYLAPDDIIVVRRGDTAEDPLQACHQASTQAAPVGRGQGRRHQDAEPAAGHLVAGDLPHDAGLDQDVGQVVDVLDKVELGEVRERLTGTRHDDECASHVVEVFNKC